MLSSDFICKEMTGAAQPITFYQKLGESKVETIRKIQTAFGDNVMGVTQIKEWYNRFKDGRTSVNSESHSTGLQQAVMTKSLPK